MPYTVTQFSTPLFNTPELLLHFGGADGISLPLDEFQLMRMVETVLFAQSRVELLERYKNSCVWRVSAEEYPYDKNLYLDERFLKVTRTKAKRRTIELPEVSVMIQKLNELVGVRYIWGGNVPEGIELLPQLYPSKKPLSELTPLISDTWRLKGVDCSGLLYHVTNGWTPRNTSALLEFKESVPIKNLTAEQIRNQLQPLDLIVWNGHVILVLDFFTSIESCASLGVIKMDLLERLKQIMQKYNPVDEWKENAEPSFVVRRFIK